MSETIVTSGQVLSGVTLEFGAGAIVSSGGLAEYNQVSAGSFITVSSGGVDQFNVLSAGGYETVLSGGMASGTSVLGATQSVDGGTVSGSYITFEVYSSSLTDGSQVVFAGGIASNTTLAALGFQTIEATGTAISTTVDFNGEQSIFTGGIASATVLSGGEQEVFSSGVASGTAVSAGAFEFIFTGGTANATSVGSGGFVVVKSGGIANFGVVSSGGVELVLSGGTVSGTTVSNGGTLVVLGGGGAAQDTDGLAGSLVVTAGVVVLFNNDTLITAGSGTVSGAVAGPQDIEYVLPSGTAISSVVSGGTENVYSGGVASWTVVENDGTENVLLGGSASFTSLGFGFQNVTGAVTGTLVGDLGTETVLNGGSAGGSMISGGGRVTVSSGGEADFATISNGGEMVVMSGGTASGATISNGGTLIVLPGGNAPDANPEAGSEFFTPNVVLFSGTTLVSAGSGAVAGLGVTSGMIESVYSGGSAVDSLVSSAGEDIVFSGGTAIGTDLKYQAQEIVDSGGVASFTTVSAQAQQVVSDGGEAVSTTVVDFGYEAVSSGGVASFTTLSGRSRQEVFSGGSAGFTTVSAGAEQIVDTGGVASFTTVSSGGTDAISGGVASGTIISGGTEDVDSGGTASGTQISSGGYQYVSSGGTSSDTVISSGGTEMVLAGGVATGTVVDSGGRLIGLPGSVVSGTVSSGGQVVTTGVIIVSGLTPVFIGSSYGPDEAVSGGETEYVLNGGLANVTVISGGAVADVYSGGLEKGGFVSAGGAEYLSGGTASKTTLLSGAAEYILSHGAASFTTVSGTAIQSVYSGGKTFGTTLEPSPTFTPGGGGIEYVYSSGVASGTLVRADAIEYVESGGSANVTTVGFNGTELVYDGGVDSGTTISTGGTEFVYSGASASGTIVNKGATLLVFPGAVANATSALSGSVVISTGVIVVSGTTVISASSSWSDKTIVSGQTEYVFPAGTAISSVIAGGATDAVFSGGSVSGTIVQDGGSELVSSGGSASFTTISGGGFQTVYSGGVAEFASVSGNQTVYSGGDATSGTVAGGGSVDVYGATDFTALVSGVEYVFSGGVASGATVDSGARLSVSSGGIVTATVVSGGGSAFVFSSGSAGGTVLLSGGVEVVSSGGIASGTVMTNGSEIDLPFLTFSGGTASIDSSTDVLTVVQGSATYSQTLAGGYPGAVFSATADNVGGTLVTLETPCYCRGTLILTVSGEVAVEDLRIGDRLLTLKGQMRPIRWIGRRAYAGRFAAGNRDVLPVRIRAGALEDGVPRRDLFISPLHAMYLDGVLIPGRDLVNGTSIEQAEAVDQVDYFHIELETHDVILAEGAPSETFVDDDSRGMFHNAAEYRALYPDAERVAARYCAPRVEDGEVLEAVGRRLAKRASRHPPSPSRHPRARPGDQSPHRPGIDPRVKPEDDDWGRGALRLGELLGHLDDANREHIAGWARDAASPDSPVRLRISDNGVVIGEVTADLVRGDLAAAGIGAGRYGFDFTVPGGLSPLAGHLIHVRRAEDGRDLPNTPWFLRASPVAPPPRLTVSAAPKASCRGHVDLATREHITGWAWDETAPDAPVALQVLDNGMPVARVLANLYREDLRQAGVGDGRHGFDIHIPGGLSPLARHVIEVTNEAGGAALDGSPIVIEAADSFDTALEQAVARAVAAIGHPGDQERVLSFMLAQAEKLRRQHAEADGRRAERQAFRQIHRRSGPAAVSIASPGRRALVVDARTPDPGRDAGSRAILSHMRALQRLGYAVAFIAAEDMGHGDSPWGEALHDEPEIACYGAPLYCSVEDVLRRQGDCFDVVYLHRADIAARYLALARAYAPRARVLYSVADLHHVRLERQAAVEERPELIAASQRMRVAECTAAWSADAVITHSADEAGLLRRLVPGANVHRVPWDVPVRVGSAPFADRHGVAFVGGYDHDPNRDAARWLVEAVMPLVWQTDPWMVCLLTGSAMPSSIRDLAGPRIETIADVADLGSEVFDRVRLTVAPLRYGAGVKGKVLDSFAAGVPCVMSEIAAEGLALPPALAGLVGRDAAEMAALICRLHATREDNDAAAVAGLSLVRRDCGADVVTEALRTAIDGRRVVARTASG